MILQQIPITSLSNINWDTDCVLCEVVLNLSSVRKAIAKWHYRLHEAGPKGMKQSVTDPKDFPKRAHLGFLLNFVFTFHFSENIANITIQFTWRPICIYDISPGLVFVTETVFSVTYERRQKKQISIKLRALLILNDEYRLLQDIDFKPLCLRYPVPSISYMLPREGNT
jgi:hypothetical protein